MTIDKTTNKAIEEAIDNLLKKPETAYIKLDETMYNAERELVDRYKSFVAEILRLSLAGIAVFGFLFNQAFQNSSQTIYVLEKSLAALGVIFFAISAICSLIFLYSATEGLRYYIAGLRCYHEASQHHSDIIFLANNYLEKRHKIIHRCRWSKRMASYFLGFGGVFMAISALFLLLT